MAIALPTTTAPSRAWDVSVRPARSDPRTGDALPDRTLVSRVRAEFSEMRGFCPTPAQAARLFGLTNEECARVLGFLSNEGFLRLSSDGRYRIGQ
jgi:hypothetical protein